MIFCASFTANNYVIHFLAAFKLFIIFAVFSVKTSNLAKIGPIKANIIRDNQIYRDNNSALVMSEFKTCKNLASWFKTCKILARILQDINQAKKINQFTNVVENIFEANYCLLNKLQKPNSIKNFLARIQNLARILQESCKFLNSENFMFVFLVAQTNWKPNEMTDIKIFDQQNWTYLTFSVNAFWM